MQTKLLKQVKNFAIKEIAESYVLVPIGQQILKRNIIADLNETAAFMYNELKSGSSIEKLVNAVLKEYSTDEETAKKDVEEFIEQMVSIDAVAVKNDD